MFDNINLATKTNEDKRRQMKERFMGVLACDRQDCESVMCDYHSETYGYICWYCMEELIEGGYQDIGYFMITPKETLVPKYDWAKIVNNEFKLR